MARYHQEDWELFAERLARAQRNAPDRAKNGVEFAIGEVAIIFAVDNPNFVTNAWLRLIMKHIHPELEI